MGLFDDVLGGTLVKNEAALDFEFVPKLLPFRESQQHYVATVIKPLLAGHSGRNLLVHGSPGIGKTAAIKWVLRDLEEKTDEVEVIFINCWHHNSTYKVLLEIADQLGYKFTQNKKTVDLYKVIETLVNKTSAVFVFDEIDKVDDLDFLYFVLEKIYKKAIILITNFKSFLVDLDERIKSRLLPDLLEFKPYSESETKQIIAERVKIAFFDGVFAPDVFMPIARKAFLLKDIRTGLFLLRESSLLAEEASRKLVTSEDVSTAMKKLDDFTVKNSSDLEADEKLVLTLVKDHSGKKIGDLFRLYQSQGGVSSYKTFQRRIKALAEGGFVSASKQSGKGGNTTIIERKLTEY
ncbi:MAG: AAA family ATPase [Candidatus Woesearchaeota archaeon]|nr:MAG: AAA family ATPase [Candidatus Woesearchaeota archaeon]